MNCPLCSALLNKAEEGHYCRCGFSIPYVYRSQRIGEKEIGELGCDKQTTWNHNWMRRDLRGQFTARLILTSLKKVRIDVPRINSPCPLCRSVLYQFKKGWSCSQCDLTIWETIAQRMLSKQEIEKLILYRKTDILSGFVNSETGKRFDATLILLENGKVSFQF